MHIFDVREFLADDTSSEPFLFPPPQRVNGRAAMLAFLAAFSAEASSHKPVVEQFSSSWFAVVFVTLLIMAGSVAPKFVTGYSLKELHATASTKVRWGNLSQHVILQKAQFFW